MKNKINKITFGLVRYGLAERSLAVLGFVWPAKARYAKDKLKIILGIVWQREAWLRALRQSAVKSGSASYSKDLNLYSVWHSLARQCSVLLGSVRLCMARYAMAWRGLLRQGIKINHIMARRSAVR